MKRAMMNCYMALGTLTVRRVIVVCGLKYVWAVRRRMNIESPLSPLLMAYAKIVSRAKRINEQKSKTREAKASPKEERARGLNTVPFMRIVLVSLQKRARGGHGIVRAAFMITGTKQ